MPDGDPVPADGSLPDQAYDGMADRTLSFYLHVPFCATRCGYCDFNTYTAGELGSAASPQSWLDAALAEIDLAAKVLAASGEHRQVSTVFVGGGTPSLVGAGPLTALLAAVRDRFGLALRRRGDHRGQPGVDRSRAAGRAAGRRLHQAVARYAVHLVPGAADPGPHAHRRAGRWTSSAGPATAGFEHVNLDLIYGTPGETDAEFGASLRAAVDSGVDHVSAYSLIVEPGTRLARQVRTGTLPMPDEDVLADRYLLADSALTDAGMSWYEVSNWARNDAARCRHNLAYWTGGDWWGIGPGAHSHVGGVRWWNVKHPAAYAAAVAEGRSPGHAREVLDPGARRMEDILLRLRLVDGLDARTADGRRSGDRSSERPATDCSNPISWPTGGGAHACAADLLADGIALRLVD